MDIQTDRVTKGGDGDYLSCFMQLKNHMTLLRKYLDVLYKYYKYLGDYANLADYFLGSNIYYLLIYYMKLMEPND